MQRRHKCDHKSSAWLRPCRATQMLPAAICGLILVTWTSDSGADQAPSPPRREKKPVESILAPDEPIQLTPGDVAEDTLDLDALGAARTDEGAAMQQLKAETEELARERRELIEQFEATRDTLPEEADADSNGPPIFELIQREINEAERLQTQRIMQLRSNIHKLESLLRRAATPPEKPNATVVPPQVAPPLTGNAAAASTAPARASDGDPLPKDSANADQPFPVTNEPVDRLGLADSLFGSGEFQLAMQIYEKIKADRADPQDEAWLEYQIACCRRRLGDMSDAEKRYRTVVGLAKDSLLGEKARWWLDVIGKRRELEQRLAQLETALEAMEPATDEAGAHDR